MAEVKTPIHGRLSTYTEWNCRCGECRAAAAAYKRKYRAGRKRALAKMGFNVTSKKYRRRPAYDTGDISRAIAVRKLLPKQTNTA